MTAKELAEAIVAFVSEETIAEMNPAPGALPTVYVVPSVGLLNLLRDNGIMTEEEPDILVGYAGNNVLMELKTLSSKPRPNQALWMARWCGRPVSVVSTPEAALLAIGIVNESHGDT